MILTTLNSPIYLMKFQNQQKGLFTFYREQQLYEDQIQQLKRQPPKPPKPPSPPPKNKQKSQVSSHSVSPKHHLIHSVSLTSPEPAQQSEKQDPKQQKVSFRKFGAAVMIANRKQTEQSQGHQGYLPRRDSKWRELGTYLQNKNIHFDHISNPLNPSSHTFTKNKKSSCKKPEEYLRYRREERTETRLPSLAKIEQPEQVRSSTESKHKISGSLLKSTGNEIIRQIWVKGEEEEQKKSVSFLQFNRDYESDSISKKKSSLSVEQKKLLEILSHYRRYDR